MRDIWRIVRAPDPEIDDVVRRELLIQTAEAARVSNLLGFGLVATADVVLLVAGVPRLGLLVWSGLCLAWLTLFHFAVPATVIAPARRLAVGASPAGVTRRFGMLQLGTGVIWGSSCLALRPGDADPGLVAVPVTMLVLANAANLLFCAATPGVYRIFHVGIVLSGGAGLAVQGNWALVAFIVFGGFGAPPLARYGYRQMAGARLLAHQNSLLADELRQEQEATEQVNLRLSEANAELQHKATRDPLTGLPNRALFSDHLVSALARGRQAGRLIGVVYFDLDHFKNVNDTLGHGAGDALLRQVASRVTGVLRSSDVLARVGGDEFVLLTVAHHTPAGAAEVAARVQRVFQDPFVLDGVDVPVTSSLGLAVDDGTANGGEQLVEFADIALYRAKELGRNRVAVFEPVMLQWRENSRRAHQQAGQPAQSPSAPNVSH
ncbi:GGDEF domain-containing protein [Kineosporia sp. J2-2]|uniref:GGDEF domain-containing protein n=1 Tax=Kineosporia corallincola TaxID=2835133 RepID=A0ABS5TMU5_9ACTN|nr:GGDEF domain-containing protein [Kineosporia corallincola]MBT0772412.1 GGDEF domain-containing protein [Kineosporia corallincola]